MERTLERADAGGFAPPHPSAASILVASDGAPASAPAFDVARLLAERSGARVELLSVLEPLGVLVPPLEPPSTPLHPGATRVEERRARLAGLIQHALGEAPAWPVEIALGERVPSIARFVKERGVQLVVTGRTHHGPVERLVRGETPLAIARATGVPVLAVPPAMSRLPRCVVVAVGLGDAGAEVGSVARALFRDAVAVHLVHVSAPPLPRHERVLRADDVAEDTAIEHAFEHARMAWQLPADVSTASHVLMGDPYRELVSFVDAADADLVVVGLPLHGRTPTLPHLASRALVSRFYRRSTRALLIVPVGETAVHRAADARTTFVVDEAQWPDLLAHVRQRNAGRRTSLAVVDRVGGAHLLANAQPLAELRYDRHGDAVTVTLGDPSKPERRLTHRVPRPRALAVHRHPLGHDAALVIRYDRGQTLITFE